MGSSHTRGIYLYVFRFISALSCRVPCPDGIKLQSLGNVRFRNWHREVGKMAIATTSSSKLSDHRKGHVAIGNTHTTYVIQNSERNEMKPLKFQICANKLEGKIFQLALF